MNVNGVYVITNTREQSFHTLCSSKDNFVLYTTRKRRFGFESVVRLFKRKSPYIEASMSEKTRARILAFQDTL